MEIRIGLLCHCEDGTWVAGTGTGISSTGKAKMTQNGTEQLH